MIENKNILIATNRFEYLVKHRLHLLLRIKEEGARLTLIGQGNDQLIAMLRGHGFEVHPVELDSFRYRPTQDLKVLMKLRRLIADNEFDLVNTFSIKMIFFTQTALRLLPAVSRPRALVSSFAGMGRLFAEPVSVQKRAAQKLFFASLGRPPLSNYERVTVETEMDRQFILENCGLTKTDIDVTKGAGIDLDQFSLGPQNRSNASAAAHVTFLLAGRMLRSKGIVEYLTAAQEILKKHANVQFQLAGGFDADDPDAFERSEIEPFFQTDGINYLGALDISQMPDLLRKSDVVVLPSSYREGIPRILLEAGACGCTFVATRIPGWQEVVGQNSNLGRMVDAVTSQSLFDAFNDLLADRQALLENGKKLAQLTTSQGLDERSVQDRVLKTYENALAGTMG